MSRSHLTGFDVPFKEIINCARRAVLPHYNSNIGYMLLYYHHRHHISPWEPTALHRPPFSKSQPQSLTTLTILSDHLVGQPRGHFALTGYYSVTALIHRSSSHLATCSYYNQYKYNVYKTTRNFKLRAFDTEKYFYLIEAEGWKLIISNNMSNDPKGRRYQYPGRNLSIFKFFNVLINILFVYLIICLYDIDFKINKMPVHIS